MDDFLLSKKTDNDADDNDYENRKIDPLKPEIFLLKIKHYTNTTTRTTMANKQQTSTIGLNSMKNKQENST